MNESKCGNACNRCQYRLEDPDPGDGHCYLFQAEPRVCLHYKSDRAVPETEGEPK